MSAYNPGSGFTKTSPWNPSRIHPVTGKVKPHRGEDWAASKGTHIPSAADGTVVYNGDLAGYGNVIVLVATHLMKDVSKLFGIGEPPKKEF